MFGYEFSDLCCGIDAFDFDVELAVVFGEFYDLFNCGNGFVFYCCAKCLKLFEGVV